MSEEEGTFGPLQRLGTLNQGPWRFAHLFTGISTDHIPTPLLPSPRTFGLSGVGPSSYTSGRKITHLLEYPRELWNIQRGDYPSSAAAATTAPQIHELDDVLSGNASSGRPGDVATINTFQSQCGSEQKKTEELYIAQDPNFETSSRIMDLPIAIPSNTLKELAGHSKNTQSTEFDWTVAGDDCTEHVERINHGAFGEVHKVHISTRGILICRCGTKRQMRYRPPKQLIRHDV